jgi:PIN domain nuclease of toxin-antitoxin system
LTNAVLVDTHIALWLGNGDERLRPSTLGLIDDCWRNGGTVLLSAVTAWEIAQLVSTGRIVLDRPVEDWIERLAGFPGVESIPLTHRAAIGAYRLDHFENRDPADRLLIATAIERACPLITYDARIVRFGEQHGSQYGFKTAA